MKKILAILILIGVMVGSSVAIASSLGPPEKVPIGQSIAYKWNYDDQSVYFEYHLNTAEFNFMLALFFGIYDGVKVYPSDGVVNLKMSYGGGAYYILDIPYGENRLLLLESLGDKDILVDGVAIYYTKDEKVRVLRSFGSPLAMPSIYSAIYKKHMSHFTHEYAYKEYTPVFVCTTTEDLPDTP